MQLTQPATGVTIIASMLDDHHTQQRKPVWVALSELFLDTELSAEDLARIAQVMAESGLSIEQLREVYLVEVAPVVSRNTFDMAGVWDGFDEEWLYAEILSNLQNRPRRTRFRAWFWLSRKMMTYATERHWKKLVGLVQGYRDGNSAP